MKRFFFLITTIITVVLIMTFKSGSAQSQDNYYTICHGLDSFYNNHPNLKIEEDGGFMEFLRWKEFWRTRVSNVDSLTKGLFNPYLSALQNSVRRKDTDGSTRLPSDWHYLGPMNVSTQMMCNGQVSAVYIDTASDNTMRTIYVGTNSSGIWKTTDGGNNWINVTDGSGLLINGITSIVGDPNNGNLLYASTSAGFLVNHTYCTGIIKSVDAGLSWSKVDSISPLLNKSLNGLLLDPNHPQRIFALYDTTVMRSMDGGIHWTTIFGIPKYIGHHGNDTWIQARFGRNIIMKPGDADHIYVSTDCWGPYPRSQVWEITNPFADTTVISTTQLVLC